MSVLVSACISYHLTVNVVLATNSTGSENTNDATMKALLTVGILVGCLVIALVVAKIVDSCYDHHIAVNDNASDISEDTRRLVRLRLAINAFRKRKATNDTDIISPSEKQKRIIRLWSSRAKESRRIAEQRRAEASMVRQGDKKSIIKVEEASGDAKITAASVAATFLTLSETAGKRTGRLNPKPERGTNKLSPDMTPKSLTPQSPMLKKKSSENLLLSPHPTPRASPVTPQKSQQAKSSNAQQPDLQKTLTGLDVDKNKAAAASAANKTSSGNVSVGVLRESHLDCCGEVLQMEFDENQDACRLAIDLGQDSVRSETNMGLVALSCRSDIRAFSGPILQGLDTSDSILVEQHSQKHESQKPESIEYNPPQVTVSQTVTTPAPDASKNAVVSVENDQKESEEDVLSPPDQNSLRRSTPSFTDTAGTDVEPADTGEDSKDSQEEADNNAEGFNVEKPKPRKIFTIVLPTEQPCPAASITSQPARQSGNELSSVEKAASSRFKNKERGRSRAQTFSAADMSKVSKMSPRLAHSVRVYTGVRDVFRVRRDLGSKKKALVSKTAQGSGVPSSMAAGTSDQRQSVKVFDTADEMQTPCGKF